MKFRLIVFRPFKGEIILGKISGGTEEGIKGMFSEQDPFPRTASAILTAYMSVGIEFFNDIRIPPNLLFDGARL